MIKDVLIKNLKTHYDQRGFFREVIRFDDEPFFDVDFGQWSHSYIFQGVIKAWHYHKIQTDYFYVCSGVLRVGLHDLREGSSSYGKTMDFLMGDHQKASCIKIPPGIAHGVKAVQGPVNLLYLMSHTYNPQDEIRIPFDDPSLGFDWLNDYPIT